MDDVGIGRHGDRHGEVGQPGDHDPMLTEEGGTLAPRYEDDIFTCAREVRADDRPQCACPHDDDLHLRAMAATRGAHVWARFS